MKLNRSMARDHGEILRDELQHIGQDSEIDFEREQRLARLLDPEGRQRVNWDGELLCSEPKRIGGLPRLLRRAEYTGDDMTAIDEGLQRGLAKVFLTHK